MNNPEYNVHIKGIAPLLQARHPSPEEEQKILQLLSNKRETKVKTKDMTDSEQMEMHAYKEKGKFVLPAEMIEAAMVKAAVNFKLEGKKTYKDLIKSGIIITPVNIVHINQNFVMDARWGVNKNTRGAVWVVRPRIDAWEVKFKITLLQDERIDPNTLKDILTYAGMYVGVGAWRPKFGRFEIVSFK